VAWEGLFTLKKYRGLNIKGSRKWNEAYAGKLLRQLSGKKHILWVNGCMNCI